MSESIEHQQLRALAHLIKEIRATAVISRQRALEAGHTDDWLAFTKLAILATRSHAIAKSDRGRHMVDASIPFARIESHLN